MLASCATAKRRLVVIASASGCTIRCPSFSHVIEVVVGGEVVAGSTRLKAGTAQKLVLNMLSTMTMVRLGKVFGNLMVNLRTTNEKLKARSWTIVSQATSADAAAVDAALAAHSGDVKAAIVSLLTDAQPEAVRQALLATDGHVKQALAHLRDHKKTIS